MPPWPSLWVVFGTSFTCSAALRNFNGGSPTSSTTDWHSASFSSSAFRSRCLLRIEAASASSCTHSGLSGEHESSSCHGILLETLNWKSCLQSNVNQALLHFEMLP
ncbi:unnamed protein product [Sphagnum balticum]